LVVNFFLSKNNEDEKDDFGVRDTTATVSKQGVVIRHPQLK